MGLKMSVPNPLTPGDLIDLAVMNAGSHMLIVGGSRRGRARLIEDMLKQRSNPVLIIDLTGEYLHIANNQGNCLINPLDHMMIEEFLNEVQRVYGVDNQVIDVLETAFKVAGPSVPNAMQWLITQGA